MFKILVHKIKKDRTATRCIFTSVSLNIFQFTGVCVIYCGLASNAISDFPDRLPQWFFCFSGTVLMLNVFPDATFIFEGLDFKTGC